MKPLNGKAYGSIPHLPNSRMGPADHSCHEGQYRICCERKRDKHDRVIVTEKLDGACVAVANVNGSVLAIGRSGYLASSSTFAHIKQFGDWVELSYKRFLSLPIGARICGEWITLAHGTTYNILSDPFIPFDVIDAVGRWPHDAARDLFSKVNLTGAHVVSDGDPISVESAMGALGQYGFHNATETIEGAVWRVERKGKFDFIAKWVRPDKIDGKYLDTVSGDAPLWNDGYDTNDIAKHFSVPESWIYNGLAVRRSRKAAA